MACDKRRRDVIPMKQGATHDGRTWGVVSQVLDVQPSRDVSLGDLLVLWFESHYTGLTIRIAISVDDLDRLRAELDAAAAALADDDDGETGDGD